jgi:hypothetical protein
LEGSGRGLIVVLSQNLLGGTEENSVVIAVTRPEFEPSTSRVLLLL